MNLFQAILLGIIQGLGEFLPISSSGHLVIAPWLLGFSDPGLSFDVALHLGTLLAVVIYFWRDFLEILSVSLFSKRHPLEVQNYSPALLWFIILATIPGAIFGYFLENYAETFFRHPLLVAFALAFIGLILYLADQSARQTKSINEMTKKDALFIGISQALAIIPGVSRAGATITAGLFLGLNRVTAARFSFLISAPIIFGATVLKFPDFLSAGIAYVEITGILTAAVSGYAAISWMLKFIERVSYKVFFWYRLALAALIVIFWLLK